MQIVIVIQLQRWNHRNQHIHATTTAAAEIGEFFCLPTLTLQFF